MSFDTIVNDQTTPSEDASPRSVKVAYLVPEKAPQGENARRKMTFYIEAGEDATHQPLYSYGISPVKHDQDYMDKLQGVYRLPEPLLMEYGEHPFIDNERNIVLGRYDKDLKYWVDFHSTGQVLEF